MQGICKYSYPARRGAQLLLRCLLLPAAWLYALATWVRNRMFDLHILKSHTFATPTICVGNITVGGTGKTPHVEYLVQLLSHVCCVGVVSRGYRRSTKGLLIANGLSTAADIGDEPFQIKQKFPNAHVAVCSCRSDAVERLLSPDIKPPVGAIVLDDAFQHRYVAAGLNILLINYNRPLHRDLMLPAGRLREARSGVTRADIVVITKCPVGLTRSEGNAIAAKCLTLRGGKQVRPCGGVYFSTLAYAAPYAVFGRKATSLDAIAAAHESVTVLAAIARPEPFIEEVRQHCNIADVIILPDHHAFTPADLARLEKAITSNGESAIVTTEKDAARLLDCAEQLSSRLRAAIYALPVKVEFLFGKEKEFNEKIIGYVRQNQGNGSLPFAGHDG